MEFIEYCDYVYKNKKKCSTEEVSILNFMIELSEDENFKAQVLNEIINNSNVCIFDKSFEIGIQQYESDIDFKILNQALSLEDYEKILPNTKNKDRPIYINFLEKYEKIANKIIKKIKLDCLGNIFLINVNINFFDVNGNKIFYRSSHSGFILIDNNQNKAFYIDPDGNNKRRKDIQYDEFKYNFYLEKKLKYLLQKCLKFEGELEMTKIPSPQYITNDIYCLFWNFYLAEQILLNYDGEKYIQPKDIIQNFRRKYKTKQDLEKVIKQFIQKNIL